MSILGRGNITEAINLAKFYTTGPTPGMAGVDVDEHKFRPLSLTRTSQTQLPEIIQSRMQEICLYLYQQNPLGHRYIEMIKDYTVGDGVTFRAKDEKVQQLLERFWFGYANRIPDKLPTWVVDLSIYGELCFSFDVRENGLVRLQYVNPSWVNKVILDPVDLSTLTKVELDPQQVLKGDNTIELLKENNRGLLEGEGAIWRINASADCPRGISDLFPLAESLAVIDDFMFNVKERARHLLMWFYDIELQGGTEETINALYEKILGQKTYPGAFRVHNEKVKWDLKAPELGGADVERTFQTMFSMVVTSLGIPPHWTGMPGAVARAGVEASQDPIFKRLITRQRFIEGIIRDLLRFQVDTAIRARKLPASVDKTVEIIMPRISMRDLQRSAGAFNRMVGAYLQSLEQGVHTPEEVKGMIDRLHKSILGEAEK